MRISDWSSDVCSSDLRAFDGDHHVVGRFNLSPADDVMITVERPLGIDTREQMVASILSKKLTAGARHLVLDIPVGPTAKVRSHEDAVRLRKLFEYVAGEQIGRAHV